jgi:hypothetical protein
MAVLSRIGDYYQFEGGASMEFKLPGVLVRQGYKDGKGYSAHITELPTGKYLASISEHNKDVGGIITKEAMTKDEAKEEIERAWKELGISTL